VASAYGTMNAAVRLQIHKMRGIFGSLSNCQLLKNFSVQWNKLVVL
jgi:hypothetical protein